MIDITIPLQWDRLPLIKVLSYTGVSLTMRRRIKHNATCTVNGILVDWQILVRTADRIHIELPRRSTFEPFTMALDIRYEDDYLMVINKPAGLLVHPTTKEREQTLANGVLAYYQRQHSNADFHPMHRLDRNTSGLVLIAKQPQIQHAFFKKKLFQYRQYEALVAGYFPAPAVTIQWPIARKNGSIIERVVAPSGQAAHTDITCRAVSPEISWIGCRLHTGRTHQIRVHCAAFGYPLLGDDLYGGSLQYMSRQALHAGKICFVHPISGEYISITAPLPECMMAIINRMGWQQLIHIP